MEKSSEYTISKDVFIPFFIGSEEETTAIMDGNLILKPVTNEVSMQNLLSLIPNEYIGIVDWEAVKSGGYANITELLAKQVSMYPLAFENGSFLKLKKQFNTIGNMAVLILYPEIFLQRFRNALGMRFANQYYGMIASVRYGGVYADPYKFNIFDRATAERWKQEMLLVARMNPNLRVSGVNRKALKEMMPVKLENLSDIAVLSSVEDLIKGAFPKELLTQEYKRYLDSFQVPKKEIKQWNFDVAANIMGIMPTKEWIEKIETILPHDQWKPVTQVEKLYVDGDSMPRLAFYENGGRDRVIFHINKIGCHFSDYGDNQKKIFNKIIRFAETECKTRFCHMSLETHADLGVIRDRNILSQTAFREERTCQRGELFEYQFLEADYRLFPSVMGIEFARRDWHYAIRLFTPNNEHIMWYDADSVMSFFDDAAASNLRKIGYLMKGNAYGRYRKIR